MSESTSDQVERRAVVASRVGLHARPAATFVQAAGQQPAVVTVRKEGGTPVDARSILGIMTLGAVQGDELVLSATGPGAQESVDALAELVERDLDA